MKTKQRIAVFFSLFFVVLIAGCSTTNPTETISPNTGDEDTQTQPDSSDTSSQGVPDMDNSQSEPQQNLNEVVAKVNEEEIQAQQVAQVQQSLMAQGLQVSEEEALDQVVAQTLLNQEVQNQGVEVSNEEAEQLIEEQLAPQNLTIEDYKEQVESQGASYSEELENVKGSLAVQKYIDELTQDVEFEVTEEEINQYYQQYEAQMGNQTPPLEQVEPQIIQAIESEFQQEIVNERVQQLEEEADIEYSS